MTAAGNLSGSMRMEKKLPSSKKKKKNGVKGYQWQPAQYKLSPNEVERLMKEERERRRKIRIVQVQLSCIMSLNII